MLDIHIFLFYRVWDVTIFDFRTLEVVLFLWMSFLFLVLTACHVYIVLRQDVTVALQGHSAVYDKVTDMFKKICEHRLLTCVVLLHQNLLHALAIKY